ncbi:MAG: ABC transporter ATP-binding protein [Rhodospirillaceae bacterium]|nr:ABC transporter ATP-binding protein [Rhodospirillaceae bacterium]
MAGSAQPAAIGETVLKVADLCVTFRTPAGPIEVPRGVSFTVRRGETLALVGESGSGKSVTSLAVMRLTPKPPRCHVRGQVLLRDDAGGTRDLLSLSDEQMRRVRGNDISMIFQEPMTSLNPVHTVGAQIAEAIHFHRNVGPRAARERALALLELVGISEPRKRLDSYPHHLSGGMRQRVMIAMALACDPKVLIADEPTTALDVTVQAQILALLKELQQRTGMGIIFITHNLGVVAEIADRVMVMYAGRIVEQADVGPLFARPMMPYTAGLLRSVPRVDLAGAGRPVLETIGGNVPDPLRMPPGCAFHPRCRHHRPGRCDTAVPALEDAGGDHLLRCARWREIAEAAS